MGQSSRKQTTDDQIANLIEKKANKCARLKAFQEWETDDLVHELSGYWLIVRSQYTPARGNIVTFADIVLSNYIRNLIATQYAQKRDVRLCTVSLDECIEGEDGNLMPKHEIYDPDRYFRAIGASGRSDATRNDLKIDLDRVLRSLSPKQRGLCRRLSFEGVTEIAKDMGVSRETVHAWRRCLRDVFKRAGLTVYLQLGIESELEEIKEKGATAT